jgi:thymidylate synthase
MSPFGPLSMEQYMRQMVYGEKCEGFEYTYHGRMRNYDYKNIDQIRNIIYKLSIAELTRRAVIVTWEPWKDFELHDPPCMDMLKFSIKDNKLCLSVVFRSHDLLKGWVNNVYAIAHLQKYISGCLDINPGWLEIISFDGHIYKSDENLIRATVRKTK